MRGNRYQPAKRTPKILATSARLASNKTYNFKQVRLAIIFILVVIFSLLIMRLPLFRVEEVKISGDAASLASPGLNSLWGVGLFSGRISSKISEILSEHPAIDTINCRKGIPSILDCRANLRKVVMNVSANGQSYAVDQRGVIFVQTANPEIPTIIDTSKIEILPGKLYLSTQLVELYLELYTKINTEFGQIKNITVADSLFLPSVLLGGVEGKLVPANRDLTVLINLERSIDTQLSTLRALIAENKAYSSTVDLRVSGFLYTF